MSTEILPTAEGDLGRTPFAHLLVYAADQQLTGALFLHAPEGTMHSVRLEAGRPAKVQMGDGFGRIGKLMVDAGIIDQKTHDLPRSAPGLIGESLVAGGHITRATLDQWVERQFFVRMTRLFNLPPATRYAYFADMNEIIDDGAPLSTVHPLAIIWAGLREHAATSAMMVPVLERIGEAPLRVHARASLERLQLTDDERSILTRIRDNPPSLRGLVKENLADESLVRKMIYALVILRFIDFGKDALPLFPEKEPTPATTTSNVALARIKLQQTAPRRFIAAAPDDVGDGERIRPQPRMRKRPRPSKPHMVAIKEEAPPVVHVPIVDLSVVAEPLDASRQPLDIDVPAPMPIIHEANPDAPHPAHTMYDLAMKRLSAGDRQGALAACQLAREIDPDEPDYAVLATWIRAVHGGANLDSCVQDLDGVLVQHPNHVPALFYRGYLRRRTNDEPGAVADLRRVIELDPTHEDAVRELKRIERRAPAKRPSGLFQT